MPGGVGGGVSTRSMLSEVDMRGTCSEGVEFGGAPPGATKAPPFGHLGAAVEDAPATAPMVGSDGGVGGGVGGVGVGGSSGSGGGGSSGGGSSSGSRAFHALRRVEASAAAASARQLHAIREKTREAASRLGSKARTGGLLHSAKASAKFTPRLTGRGKGKEDHMERHDRLTDEAHGGKVPSLHAERL